MQSVRRYMNEKTDYLIIEYMNILIENWGNYMCIIHKY